MKSYKPKKRPEISSYETGNLNLPNALLREGEEQAKLAGKDAFRQLIGIGEHDNFAKTANDNQPNANIQQFQAKETPKKETTTAAFKGIVFEFSRQLIGETKFTNASDKSKNEPGINYHNEYYASITRSGENLSRREVNENKKQIEQITIELKKLVTSMKTLQAEFGHVTVDTAPSNPGKYYVNFFEWMLIMIKQAREKVEDSNAWLNTVQGKNSKKSGYWGKAKKLGTSFSQANERNVATSTG